MTDDDNRMARFFDWLRREPLGASDLDKLEEDLEADGVIKGPDEWFEESSDALDVAWRSMHIENLVSNAIGTEDFSTYLKQAAWFGYSLDGIEDPETLKALLAFTVWERKTRGDAPW